MDPIDTSAPLPTLAILAGLPAVRGAAFAILAAVALGLYARQRRMRRPVMRVGMTRMNSSLSPPAHASTPDRMTAARSASESTGCAAPWTNWKPCIKLIVPSIAALILIRS